MSPKILAANLFEYALVAAGWILIWRLQFTAKARASRDSRGQAPTENFQGLNAALAALWLFLTATLFTGYAQLSFMIGAVFALFSLFSGPMASTVQSFRPTHAQSGAGIGFAAVLTFIIVVSVVIPVQNVWEYCLVRLNLPTSQQELIDIFKNAKSTKELVSLTVTAVIIAPVTEELFFRAGLFRFCRGRLPRLVALVMPALIFASLHVDRTNLKGLITVAPLTGLGIVFSLAYERTGRIAVPIIAHALFNLHTLVFLLLGLSE